ncbi:MAG: hypothetical protein LBD70_03500 [Bifidobacteriaceae bacterium]|jgi:hypothetical protein|nr:hypothetical protein [Bifidobacteriaceae bacterium]
MFRTTARKTLASIAAAATAAAALVAIAQPAAAAPGDPLRLGDLHISPASGKINPDAGAGWLTAAWTDPGEICPEGYRQRSGLYGVIDGTPDNTSAAGVFRAGSTYQGNITGLEATDDHIYRTGDYVSSTVPAFPWEFVLESRGATVTMRHTCQTLAGYFPGSDMYYESAAIQILADGTWTVLDYTPPVVIDDSSLDITVVVPQAGTPPEPPTGLSISVKPGATTLSSSETRVAGQVWTATGTLGNVTVNDDRQDSAAADWTLNGKASTFIEAGGTTPISPIYLGWTPNKVSGAGTAGGAVAVGAGLATDMPLATGTASDTPNVLTTVNATLTLGVPPGAEDGSYKSTLTLTLI